MPAVQQRESTQQQVDVEEDHSYVESRYGQHVGGSRPVVGRSPFGRQFRAVACGHCQRDGLRVGRKTEPSDMLRSRFMKGVSGLGTVGRLKSQRGQPHAEEQQGDSDVRFADAVSERDGRHKYGCEESCGQKTGGQRRMTGDHDACRREEQHPDHRKRPCDRSDRSAAVGRRM